MAGYCAQTDVESVAQTGAYGAGTIPTATQVLEFIDWRGAEIYSWLRGVLGDVAPGPSGYSVTIDTGSDAGLALADVTKMANATGAAMDALQAAGASESVSRSERVSELFEMYQAMRPAVERAALAFQGESDDSATHISSGEITTATVVSREEDGLSFKGSTEW